MKEYRCGREDCNAVAAAMGMSSAAVARIPESWRLCPGHLRESLGITGPAPSRKKRSTCYGMAGKCENEGMLYPGGFYCSDHSPRKANTESVVSLQDGS